jgi:L-seryl-tRNA(Ser) seleniumtransferase
MWFMSERLRLIPSIDKLLDIPEIQEMAEKTSRIYVRDTLRLVLDELRADISDQQSSHNGDIVPEIKRRLSRRLYAGGRMGLRRVINATGVVLHTNLGRAPLAAEAIEAVNEIAAGYSNLEYDLVRGARGNRDTHCEEIICELTGAESAVAVNNNAAAVLLTLNELARGGEVIVSRGELVEIGGGFRVPEVIERSGVIQREIGTTNKTRLGDYESAINEKTRAILRVHPSNFKIVGFTTKPPLDDLIELSRRTNIPLIEDLGSGCLVDPESIGASEEPIARNSIKAGVPVVTFSGDKLMGGPQCGIIVGNRDLIGRIRKSPLMRAFRVDKMTYAALEATLIIYREGRYHDIPVLRMLKQDGEELLNRACSMIAKVDSTRQTSQISSTRRQVGALTLTIGQSNSVTGGGSAPTNELPAWPVEVEHKTKSANQVEAWLRRQPTPIISRIENDRVLIDLRAVTPDEEPIIIAALSQLGSDR